MQKLVSLAVLSLALTGCNPAGLIAGVVSSAVGGTSGSTAIKFSAASGTNATTTDFGGSGAVFKGESNGATPPTITFGATTVDVFAGNFTRLVTVTLTGATPTTGATVPVASLTSAVTGVGAAVTYSEPAVKTGDKLKTWLATGGSLSIDAAGGGSISVTLKGCTMSSTVAGASVPNSDNTATGTFTMDGTLKVDAIKGF